ncbi:MAG: DNA-3-methyladenine glycosylase [Succiniclasticum sp.]|jgi:DNA-3-methyladenine glycosylase|nr:DNA-3-methyladenine glycosylase [Succiniclasticum sp.]MEE3478533.1 DNA-3-methyladenine glycosylase [Succiniclasticum sp.]
MDKIPEAAFYLGDTVEIARHLLGKLLVHETPEGTAGGMIVETEAYVGAVDKACHAWHNRSARTEVMFHAGGVAYVYLIYGMHHCFNVVTGPEGEGNAVLIRALEPVLGTDLMKRRRGTASERNLCNGPGKLCRALAITREDYGADLRHGSLRILDFRTIPAAEIAVSERVNVDYAEEAARFPWRFTVRDNPFVSKVPGHASKSSEKKKKLHQNG